MMSVPLVSAQSQQVTYAAAVPDLAATGGTVSGSAWVYVRRVGNAQTDRQTVLALRSTQSGVPTLTLELNTGGAGSVGLTRGNGTATPLVWNTAPNALGAGSPVRNRGWHHLAFVYRGGVVSSDVRLFVDGVEVPNAASPAGGLATPVAGNGGVILGSTGSGGYMDGALRDIGLWYDRELTPADVALLSARTAMPSTVGGTGLMFAPSLDTDAKDPISTKTGTLGGGTLVGRTYTPPVMNGLIAAYEASTSYLDGGGVSSWPDSSGGGNNLFQTNPPERPWGVYFGGPNNQPFLSFNPFLIGAGGGKTLMISTANADLPTDRFTVLYAGSVRIPAGTGGGGGARFLQTIFYCPPFSLRVGGPLNQSANDANLAYVDAANAGGVFATTLKTPSIPSVLAWRGVASGSVSMTRLNTSQTVSRVPSATGSSTTWRIGAAPGPNYNGFLGNTNTVVLYNRDLTDAELTLVRSAMASSAGVALDPKRVLVVEGSSSAAGYFASNNQDYSWRSRFLRNDVAYNFARGGDDIVSNGVTDIRTQAAATVDTVVQPGKPNLLILQIGANDLAIYPPGTGSTTSDTARATSIFNNVKAYCQARRTAGFTRIAVVTLLSRDASGLPSGQTNFDSRRAIYNSLVRAEVGKTIDAVIDLASDPQIGVDRYFQISPWLTADNTHLSDQGFDIAMGYIEKFLSTPKPRVPQSVPLLVR